MIDLGLRPEERRALLRTLRDSHQRRITVTMRNRNEDAQEAIRVSSRLVAGEVMGDVSQDVTRSLSLGLVDPEGKLRFEGRSPAHGAVFADRFVSVEYGVFVPDEIGDWVDVPVFWGPVTDFSRNGHLVTIEAQGKERLMLAPHYATEGYTLPKGLRVDEAIRRVARKTGERRFNLPRIDRKLSNPRTVSARAEPWKVINGGEEDARGRKIAGIVERAPGNRFAFYDGAGRLTVRRRNQNPAITIRDSRDLVEAPDIQYDNLDAINTVVVRGREPDGKGKKRARAKVTLPDGHPISPVSLRRNGENRHMTEFVDTELRTDLECANRARQILRRRSAQGVDAELRVVPNPLLEELDVIRLATDEYDFEFPLRHWVLPLTDGPMTLATRRRTDRRLKARKRYKFKGGAVIDRKYKGGL